MGELSLDQFRDSGYQISSDVIDSETLRTIRLFLEEGAREALDQIRKVIPFERSDELIALVDERQHAGSVDLLEPEISKLVSGHLPLHRRLDSRLWAVARSPGLRRILKQLFPGQQVRMHLPPAARYVLPGNHHAMVPAHQDFTYNKHMPEFVTIWIPFVPIDKKCGGVAVYRGTHRTPELVQSERRGFWFEGISKEAADIVPCEVPLGGALLLSPSIIHGSSPNASNRVRYSIDYRFFGDGGSSKHYLDLETMNVVAPPSQAPAELLS
jgi:hypothetical protein